jgi:hypothetical protein
VTCDRSVVSLGTPVSSTQKFDHHDIIEILLKVALNTINQTNHNWLVKQITKKRIWNSIDEVCFIFKLFLYIDCGLDRYGFVLSFMTYFRFVTRVKRWAHYVNGVLCKMLLRVAVYCYFFFLCSTWQMQFTQQTKQVRIFTMLHNFIQ